MGTSFMLLCLLGGFVGNSFLSRYRTIAIFVHGQRCQPAVAEGTSLKPPTANVVTNFMNICFMLLCLLVGFVTDSFLGRGGQCRQPVVTAGTSPKPPTGKRAPIQQAGRRRRGLAVVSQSQIIMASVAAWRSLALVLVVVGIFVTGAAAGSNKLLNITNHCSYTVWPGILSGAAASSTSALDTTGFELAPGESRSMSMPTGWSGRVWGRTLCSTDAGTGKFTCVTGDCSSGKQDCTGGRPALPATLAQFTLDGSGGMDSYDVSLVDGFNLPLLVAPQGAAPGAGNCAPTGCVADLNAACPAELRVTSAAAVTGAAVACKSACLAFGNPQYCCTGEYGNPSTCEPTAYSEFFKHACPPAYSYAYDGAGSSFTCGGEDTYTITFCPSVTSGKTNTTSEPSGNGNLPLINGGGSTTPYTAGGSGSTTPNTGGGSQPWRIALVVAIFGAVTAALGLLAQFLGLFEHCCNSPTQGAGGAAGQNNPSASMIQINNYVGRSGMQGLN